jgi:signal recognition particle receptor subunit beta
MISLADCIAFCDLDEAEVLAIAEHEHIPEIVACALTEKLLKSDQGPEQIRDMMRDDVRAAITRGDKSHVRELVSAMHHVMS